MKDPEISFELKKGECSDIDLEVVDGKVYIVFPGGVGYTIRIPRSANKVRFEANRKGDYVVELLVKEVME